MLKALAVLLALVAMPAFADSLRQFQATTATPMNEILSHLAQRLPQEVMLSETADGAMVAYTGTATPDALQAFLGAAFIDLPPETLLSGRTVSLALTLTDHPDGTDMSLMVMGRFTEGRIAAPDGAVVMLDGRGRGDCVGQLVLRHPLPRKEAAPLYRAQLESAGFAFPGTPPDEVSFFIGYAPDCTVALYLEEQRGTTLVALRYLED